MSDQTDKSAPTPRDPARCACPSMDARRCYCLRYAPDDTMPKDEACDCSCHEDDDDDDDDDAPR